MLPPDAGFNPDAIGSQLQRTQPWVRFLAILGFVSAGFMILGGLFAGAFAAMGLAGADRGANMQVVVLLFLYPLFGVLYVYPSLCLLRYADHIRRYLAAPGTQHLEAALDAQRSFWKFAGILAVLSIVASIALFVVAIVLGVAASLIVRPS
jgi:hypothetical protein